MAVAVLIAATLFVCVSPERASAQPYEVPWYTIDGGGTMEAAGGGYEAGGTIGQPDAGRMTSATYTVTGGFWVVALPLPAKRPMAEDCATIAPGTRCDVDGGADPCVTDEDCADESHCVPAPVDQPGLGNVCYAPKTRYLSIARNPEQEPDTARRVKLQDGYCEDAPGLRCVTDQNCEDAGAAGPCVPDNVVLGWVDTPYEAAGLWLAEIVDAPVNVQTWPDVVHVWGCEIAHASLSNVTEQHCKPNSIVDEKCVEHCYIVQASSDGVEYSEELMLCTTSTWGDMCSLGTGGLRTPPDGLHNLADIMAAIGYFQGETGIAPLTWLDIAPSFGTGIPDQVIGVADISGFKAGFQGSPYPGLGPKNCGALSAHIGSYSNSGCLPGSDGGRDYVWCPDDEIELTVGPGTLHVLHKDATYWCAQEDIVITLSIEGNVLKLTEKEINPEPTDCLCCYNVEATVVDLSPGEYTVEFCWNDYESGWEQVCYVENIVIP